VLFTVFTIAMIFVWGWSSKGLVHRITGGGPVSRDHEILSVSNKTHVTGEQERVLIATPIASQEPAGEREPDTEHSHVTTRSRNAGVVIQDNHFEITSTAVDKNLNNKADKSRVLHKINNR